MSRFRYMLVARFGEESGYSQRAIVEKIRKRAWLEGHEYIRAPDGRILIDLDGVEQWAMGKRNATEKTE